jgi:hypothetical protein
VQIGLHLTVSGFAFGRVLEHREFERFSVQNV